VCILERYLEPARLSAVQHLVGGILDTMPLSDRKRQDYGHTELADHPLLAQVILDELVIAAFEDYLGRPLYLADCHLTRAEPIEPYEERAYRWHHDGKGKYLKTMWLLTDVPADGQRMSFIAGSHRRWRSALTYEETRFTDARARRLGPVVECAAPAGSVVLFDTNAIHKGNRNLGPRREVLFGTYSAGRHLGGFRAGEDDLPGLSARQRAVLDRSRTASPGYGAYRDSSVRTDRTRARAPVTR
jgi:hypothetical protein